jgi:hypothetical protein
MGTLEQSLFHRKVVTYLPSFPSTYLKFVCQFYYRSISKFSKRRKSVEYRTDFPVFRPTIIDMVWDARQRLITFKQSTVHSTNQGSVLLSEQVLAGAGRCLVPFSDVDRAIDAYTQFIHRYALHVSSLYNGFFVLCSTMSLCFDRAYFT